MGGHKIAVLNEPTHSNRLILRKKRERGTASMIRCTMDGKKRREREGDELADGSGLAFVHVGSFAC